MCLFFTSHALVLNNMSLNSGKFFWYNFFDKFYSTIFFSIFNSIHMNATLTILRTLISVKLCCSSCIVLFPWHSFGLFWSFLTCLLTFGYHSHLNIRELHQKNPPRESVKEEGAADSH